jgi:hypothetical protein
MNLRTLTPRTILPLAFLAALAFPLRMKAQFGPPPPLPPSTKANAPWDITGYWVALVTEDWRFRMVPLSKGDYPGLPLNDAGKKIADAWDPAKDEAAGDQCKSYGAAAIMRVPGRLHITWDNDTTMKVEMDAGTQTRLFHLGGTPGGKPSLQGYSAVSWVPLAAGGPGPAKMGSMKIVTTNLLPGYLRKNGVPYSDKAVVTEYIDFLNDPNASGEQWLIVKTIVDDPTYLLQPVITSTNFKRQADATGFTPSACTAR